MKRWSLLITVGLLLLVVSGCSKGSATPTPTPLPAPTLKGSCSDNGQTLLFNWDPIPGAVRYAVRIDDQATPWGGDNSLKGDTVENHVPGTSTSYSRPASVGPMYKAWIHAVNDRGVYSEPSMQVFFTCSGLDHTVRKIGDSPIPAPEGQYQCLNFSDSDFLDRPAHTVVRPGQKFTKVWGLQNNCKVSTEGMRAVKIGGGLIGPTEFLLGNIPPGGTSRVSAEITVPEDLPPCVHTALYRVLNKDNEHVSGFWVDAGIC